MTRSSFSEEEGRHILSRAAERQEAAERARLGSGHEMSLQELTEIALEVGIDPAHVRAAAGELVLRKGAVPAQTSMGIPKELSEVRVLPGTVSDRQWEEIVGVFRETFGVSGFVTQFGEVREWMSSSDANDAMPIKLRLEPHEDGTMLTIGQSTKTITALGGVLAGAFAGIAAMLGAIFAAGDPGTAIWALPGVFAVLSLGGFLGSAVGGRRFVRKREDLFDRVADKVELIGRPEDG